MADNDKGEDPVTAHRAKRKTLKDEGFKPDPDVEAGHDDDVVREEKKKSEKPGEQGP